MIRIHKFIIMTTLKDLTLKQLSLSLPQDVLYELVQHHMKDIFLPNIIDIHAVFAEVEDKFYPDREDDFMELLIEFSSLFPHIVKKSENLKNITPFYPHDEWDDLEECLNEKGYEFYGYDAKLIYKRDSMYYSFSTKNIQGYKTHNNIISFFCSRGMNITRGYNFVVYTDFDRDY